MANSITSERRMSNAKLSSSLSTTSFRDRDDVINSINESFSRFLKHFPKEVKRRDLTELYNSLRYGTLDEGEEIDEGVNALLSLLFNTDTLLLDRLLVIDCLQIIAPQPDLCEAMVNGDITCLANCLSVALAQGPNDMGFKSVVDKIINNLDNPKISQYQQKIIAFLGQLVIPKPLLLSTEQMKKVTNHVVELLKYQHKNPSTKELDGSLTRETPTVLSVGEFVTPEQVLSNQCFLFVRPWFENICSSSNSTETSSSTDPFSSLRLRELLSPEVLSVLKEYCTRIIDQSERTTLVATDVETQKAALAEALNILSLICDVDNEHIPSCLAVVRRLHDRNVTKHPNYLDITTLVATSQFLIRHSSIMMHKMDDIGPFLLRDTVPLCYNDNTSSFEIVKFIRDNLAKLCYNSSLLEKYFPSLLKIVAWNPSTFESDFVQIVPSFLSPTTSIEAFHALLDLPCLTASLILQQGNLKQTDVIRVMGNPLLAGLDPLLLQLYINPDYQAMFNYILRPASGIGDTFNRVEVFHKSIEPLIHHPRVIMSSKTAVGLLKCFFEVFIQHADTGLASLLFPAMLDRLNLLYPIKGYREAVQKVIAEAVLKLFNKHPVLVIHLHEELVDFISEIKKAKTATGVFIHLVWAIGEYTSIAYSEMCNPEIVSKYYDGLETVIYEILSSSSDVDGRAYPKLICVVLTSLAQLSSRSQELLPRAILCLSKAAQKMTTSNYNSDDEENEDFACSANKIVMDRINELLAILRMPNVASLLLSPSKDIYSGRWHKDPTSLPMLLKTIVTIVSDKPT